MLHGDSSHALRLFGKRMRGGLFFQKLLESGASFVRFFHGNDRWDDVESYLVEVGDDSSVVEFC